MFCFDYSLNLLVCLQSRHPGPLFSYFGLLTVVVRVKMCVTKEKIKIFIFSFLNAPNMDLISSSNLENIILLFGLILSDIISDIFVILVKTFFFCFFWISKINLSKSHLVYGEQRHVSKFHLLSHLEVSFNGYNPNNFSCHPHRAGDI